ncbi:SPOSA6832_02336 [Sporobolomyces salmonicolor]|uniref:Signal recognition particle subunit SRP68 n=1 Tax=Sporidiobolus salmonicolor TaxID=5005 RepID=A0A0D6EM32_SPOSA|nr:SPOSA6832_02336 [Sporobolomyces salmonicolor]
MATPTDHLNFPRELPHPPTRRRPRLTLPPSSPVLKLVSDARNTYGLRHQDFGRYKCVALYVCPTPERKLTLSLRQIPLRYQGPPSPQVCWPRPDRRSQQKVSEEGVGCREDHERQVRAASLPLSRPFPCSPRSLAPRHLQILLFDSERCWAQSQLLKATLSDVTAPPSTKHHLAKRLLKASSHAQHLVDLSRIPSVSSRLSASHLGQIQAYYLVLTGSLAFERGKHDQGLKTLSVAYEVLGELAANAGSATDEALANEMMDEVEPMLRFCAYRLGKDTASGVAVIAKEIAAQEIGEKVDGWGALKARLEEEGKEGKKEAIEVRWRGELIPVRNAELVSVAVRVKQALKTLEKDQALAKKGGEGSERQNKAEGKKEIMGARRMGTYDKALLVLSDAEQVASQLVEDNKVPSSRPLTLFHSYVQYHLLAIRTKRDLLLIASTSFKLASRESKILQTEKTYVARTETRDPAIVKGKIQKLRTKAYPGLVKVYDTVLLSLEAMRDMEIVEQDDELATTVEARIEFIRAQRCLYLSRFYALAAQFPSSLALNSRAKLYARQSRSTALSLSPSLDLSDSSSDGSHDFVADLLPLDEGSFDKLERSLEADHERISREWFEATGGKLDVADDLAVEDLSLSDSKARDQGKSRSKKPAFYDVAYNYVVAFDMEAIARKAGLGAPDEAEEAEDQPMHEEKVEEKEQQETPSNRGWGFGLFGRR